MNFIEVDFEIEPSFFVPQQTILTFQNHPHGKKQNIENEKQIYFSAN